MFSARKSSVRVHLTVVVLAAIVFSWVLSNGTASYLHYLQMRSLRAEMMKHPIYGFPPMPEPRFGVLDFFLGRSPLRYRIAPPPRVPGPRWGPPMMQGPWNPGQRPAFTPPRRPSLVMFELRWLILRLAIALALAIPAAAWLARRFTKPLTELARGADAFQSGDFSHRIRTGGKDEFSAVALAMNEMAGRVADQIESLRSDAERRRRFLADIAHELRSPVTTMRTMAGALSDGVADEPERRKRAEAALVDTSERLSRLVQDLIELARLDLDELPLNKRPVDLNQLVKSALASHEAAAAEAGITLLPLDETLPVTAEVDPDRITQVFDNIIGNALCYAGRGAELRVSLAKTEDAVRITFTDTGRGITPEHLPHVVESFYRADAARTPGDCHSGLGLSIASRLVEAHGGKLTVTSEGGVSVEMVIRGW